MLRSTDAVVDNAANMHRPETFVLSCVIHHTQCPILINITHTGFDEMDIKDEIDEIEKARARQE